MADPMTADTPDPRPTGLAHDHKPGTPCTIRCPVWWWVTIDRFTRERPRDR